MIDYESIFIAIADNPAVSTESHKIALKGKKVFKVISKEIE